VHPIARDRCSVLSVSLGEDGGIPSTVADSSRREPDRVTKGSDHFFSPPFNRSASTFPEDARGLKRADRATARIATSSSATFSRRNTQHVRVEDRCAFVYAR